MQVGLCEFVDDGGYDPPTVGDLGITVYRSAELREVPSLLDVSTGIDNTGVVPPSRLDGGFGPSFIQILALIGSDPDSSDSVFSSGDTITVSFSEPTNQGFLPSTGITTSQIDNLLHFQASIGTEYEGAWLNSQTLRITVLNATGNGAPALDTFFVTTKKSGGLRNTPAISVAVRALLLDVYGWLSLRLTCPRLVLFA